MSRKYVAAIMNRVSLDDGNFIYYISHPAIGEIDETTRIFTDKNGREYLYMFEEALQMSEVSTAYYKPIPMDMIKKEMECTSTKEAISEYDYLLTNYIYYVSQTPEAGVFCVPININDLKAKIGLCVEDYNAKIKQGLDPKGGFVKTSNNKEEQRDNEDQEDCDDETMAEHVLSSKEIRSDIAALLMEIQEGVYSLEELKELRDTVKLQQEDIEGLVDSLELQIEASEKGESSIKLKGDDDSTLKTKEKEVGKSDEKTPIKLKEHLDLDELYKKVTRTLIAQDEPTRRVITEIARKIQSVQGKNRGLLITGQTGSGKTKMMQLIAKYIDRPFFKVDSTQLTMPGYVGKDIEELLWDAYIACGKDKDKTEKLIIYFDEIDKKGSSRKDDVSGKGVLNVLLPFIEGTVYDATENVKGRGETVKIDTSNMIVILGGAFTDVYKELKAKGEIGFGAKLKGTGTREATTEDFVVKAKMPDEFMGRVSIIKLNDLDVEAIKKILLESDESAIKLQQQLFEELGVKLTFDDSYVDKIAEQAEKRKTGARGLNTVVDETTWEAYGDAYTHLGEYEEIILGSETVDNPKQYRKIPRKKVAN